MIARKEALLIARNLRRHAEKELGRPAKRSAAEAEKKASTDINSAVARGHFPYAQARDGYPEWAFHLLRDIYPAIIEAERGAGDSVKYGELEKIEIPEKYAALMMFADFRAVLRGAKKTFHTPELAWRLFETAFDAFDLHDKRYKPGKSGAENVWTWAEGHLDEYEKRPPTRKEVLRDIDQGIGLVETFEKALARELGVSDLSEPPFSM